MACGLRHPGSPAQPSLEAQAAFPAAEGDGVCGGGSGELPGPGVRILRAGCEGPKGRAVRGVRRSGALPSTSGGPGRPGKGSSGRCSVPGRRQPPPLISTFYDSGLCIPSPWVDKCFIGGALSCMTHRQIIMAINFRTVVNAPLSRHVNY